MQSEHLQGRIHDYSDVPSSVLARCSPNQTPPTLSGEFGRFNEYAVTAATVLEWLFVTHTEVLSSKPKSGATCFFI